MECLDAKTKNEILKYSNGNKEIPLILEGINECSFAIKGKRPKTKYNFYISECMRKMGKSKPASERMKGCALEWSKWIKLGFIFDK